MPHENQVEIGVEPGGQSPYKLKQAVAEARSGLAVEALVVMGFTEKLRAMEVLPQLQRLRFKWSEALRTAVAVQVEDDGRLRLHHSQLLDPESGLDEGLQWKAILSAIVPLPHMPLESSAEVASKVRAINDKGTSWLKRVSLDRDFVRNVAAVLRPGNSAILAILWDSESALEVLFGYSNIVLHTALRPTGSDRRNS